MFYEFISWKHMSSVYFSKIINFIQEISCTRFMNGKRRLLHMTSYNEYFVNLYDSKFVEVWSSSWETSMTLRMNTAAPRVKTLTTGVTERFAPATFRPKPVSKPGPFVPGHFIPQLVYVGVLNGDRKRRIKW